jgi:hypothetical protein
VSLGKVVLRHLNFTEDYDTMTTKTNIALAELAEKGADGDLLGDMIQLHAALRCANARRRSEPLGCPPWSN